MKYKPVSTQKPKINTAKLAQMKYIRTLYLHHATAQASFPLRLLSSKK